MTSINRNSNVAVARAPKSVDKTKARALAKQLQEAMKGWGTDEDAVFNALKQAAAEPGLMAEVEKQFNAAYGRDWDGGDLQGALADDMGGSDLAYARQIISGAKPAAAAASAAPVAASSASSAPDKAKAAELADQIHEAMCGWGTDEDAIFNALKQAAAEPGLMAEVEKQFNAKHGADWEGGDLRGALADEMGGADLAYAREIIGGAKPARAASAVAQTPTTQTPATPQIAFPPIIVTVGPCVSKVPKLNALPPPPVASDVDKGAGTSAGNVSLVDTAADAAKDAAFGVCDLLSVLANPLAGLALKAGAKLLLASPEIFDMLSALGSKGGKAAGGIRVKDLVKFAVGQALEQLGPELQGLLAGIFESGGGKAKGHDCAGSGEAKGASDKASASSGTANAWMSDPTISIEDKILMLLVMVTKKKDEELQGQIEKINSLQGASDKSAGDGDTSIDVETTKLNQMVRKRNQVFDTLREILNNYNQTARGIIQNLGPR